MNPVSTRLGLKILLFIGIVGSVIVSLPTILAFSIQYEQERAFSAMSEQFPVTVNPHDKSIVENTQVNDFLESAGSPLQAAAINVGSVFGDIFAWIAITISNAPAYQSLAAVAGSTNRFVAITPGMRKEQVVSAFGNALAWNAKQKKEFLTTSSSATPPLFEGSFAPGIYSLANTATPIEARSLVNERFVDDILSHYGSETAEIVPLDQALIIASLIEREAGGPDDMRLISGIIWNRLFIRMNLQIDATLQYVKASSIAGGAGWWPRPLPTDRSRKSPYNTYLHSGLPPAPIANPSVAAILAALNPKNTSCLFYFHDAARQFHCTDTYAEHVALLKKYYGRGK